MFVSREIVTQVGFTAATARLANLLTGNGLQNAPGPHTTTASPP